MDSMAKQKMLAAKLDNTTWISALQLALWDNIFGPRVDQVRSPQRRLPVLSNCFLPICGVAAKAGIECRRDSSAA
jgi:hypothetical protein